MRLCWPDPCHPKQQENGKTEDRKRQNLGNNSSTSVGDRRSKRDKIAGHMGGEQALQGKKPGSIDIAGVQTQIMGRFSFILSSVRSDGAAALVSPSSSELYAEVIAVVAAGVTDSAADLVVNRFDGTAEVGRESIVQPKLT